MPTIEESTLAAGAATHDLVEQLDALPSASPARRSRSGAELSVGILLWPRFPLLSLAGLCDALRHAADRGDQSRQLRCLWTVVGAPGEAVEASCGIPVPVQSAFADPAQFDYLVVIGGLLPHLDHADRRYWDYLQQAAGAGVPLVGLCTGSFVLARAGLMDDRVACVHSFHLDDYRRLFPALRVVTHADYLIDGDRITCAGGISVVELSTRLISLHCGPDRASKVIHQMTVSRQRGGSFVERRAALGYPSVEDATVRHAVLLMEENLEAPLNIAAIAKMIGTSVRHLERTFMAEMNTSPNEFYRRMRLRYARWMLVNTTRKITDIAYECGFADSAHFIRVFRESYGVTPGKLRASRGAAAAE
ncbi:GlxA family transcriptional regulator [Paraburkholderia caballeronis]|uniref:Transcriptional regulator GlxA family, contains an amidase domain and an AraC-type DNA-binding HTH domain n=1 Tax=Paraburkholderia caballeronis TaxID=416943 RepID=A0A1H7LH95_9BURK|nr:GlxA family transcriptional regulator [Paraburkholderia caballeronis]PXW28447.1 AraC family transcriptional regulator with amidase-like domain [Paraburkholderia caballeronis]PXX03813.1 AraC family transcriptional regulator with amidase-like domain [Paraburkholderia caballeronis]RAK04557.1 AraC family transcriptional regulator with amidase-like domain [Paraburkholderia caballeronis]TDV19466.1 AraC family transcriptional regulator with amidase-like domain [Paraburkholderia caballeronis]TDV220